VSENTKDVSEVPEAVIVSDGKESSGWLVFAAMMMFGLGTFVLVAAIAEALSSSWLLENTLLGARIDWFWYGFFDLLVAIGSFYAGWAILTGRAGGFMLGFIFATLSAARWFLLVPIAPLWSAIMVGLWVLVIYALIKTSDYAL
jgi:hypothetical protein